jgi:hypothetical protein
MIKRKVDKFWFPWWPEKWLWGTIRIECTPAERGIWVDLLSLASKDDGHIRANEETPYPIKQLSGMLILSEKELDAAINKFLKLGKLIKTKTGTLYVAKWEKYQFSERHKRRMEDKMSDDSDTMSKKGTPILNNNKINQNTLNNNKIKESKSPCLEKFQDEDIQLTQLLIDKMIENNPLSSIIRRLTPKRQEVWIDECRKLREIDKRSFEQIEQIIIFSQDDSFWKSNILSMPKLREKFDQLWLKAKKEKYAGIKEWLNESRK